MLPDWRVLPFLRQLKSAWREIELRRRISQQFILARAALRPAGAQKAISYQLDVTDGVGSSSLAVVSLPWRLTTSCDVILNERIGLEAFRNLFRCVYGEDERAADKAVVARRSARCGKRA